jgi:hypothetical protein
MGLAVVVIANDFSAINVALPTMEKDFETDVNTIQWVVNAYEGLAKLAARVAKRDRRVGDFTDTSLSGGRYPNS